MQSDDVYVSPDARFRPNLVNSSIFILTSTMQLNNFVINYRGAPFTQSLSDNVMLLRAVQAIYGVLIIIVGQQVTYNPFVLFTDSLTHLQIEPLNDLLQMYHFPSAAYQTYLLGILAFNFLGSWGVEKLSLQLEV